MNEGILGIGAGILYFINIVLAILIIFFERKKPESTWAWLFVLSFIPIIGFLLYLLIGQNLSKKKMFMLNTEEDHTLKSILREQLEEISEHDEELISKAVWPYKDIITMHIVNSEALYTQSNSVEVFSNGDNKFDSLLKDLNKAEDHIHMLYYIFKDDDIGTKIISALTLKASQGIKVKLLIDGLGGRTLHSKSFSKFKKAGGELEFFFPSNKIVRRINTRVNYRNHRKMVIIDGKIGYVGGYNVGDEYLGKDPRFGYWRDTHLKITGQGVYGLQIRFLQDWSFAVKKYNGFEPYMFPEIEANDNVPVQIVSSGPDSEWEQIKNGFLKFISSAQKSIYIQSPYFVPDSSIMDSLKIAILSGIDVKIMIPSFPDHPFVYWASYSYIGELVSIGAECYCYTKGFLHAKTIVIDDKIASVGTANWDVRSFKLNFEVNAFIYDRKTAKTLSDLFINDIKDCDHLTHVKYLKRPLGIKFKESISRLLAPIL